MPDWPSSPTISEVSPLEYSEMRVQHTLDKGYWSARNFYHKPLRKFTIKYLALSPSDKNTLIRFLYTLRGEATDHSIVVPHGHTVINATNASPIVVTVSNSHEYFNGDTVVITGVNGNTAANGTFIITSVTSSTLTLVGSTGNGAFSDPQGDALVKLKLPNAKVVYEEGQFQGVEKILGPDVNNTGYFNVECLIEELYVPYTLTVDE